MLSSYRVKYGVPESITIKEVKKPTPKPNEILVKVFATTINRTDEGVLLGKPWIFRLFVGLPNPRYTTLGTDFAGMVESVGNEVTKFKVGDRVWGFNDQGIPSQAEYISLKEKENIAFVPTGWSYAKIVACAEGAHYARNFIKKVLLVPGKRAMVYGATGAIGSAMMQMLKFHKLYVTAVCVTDHVNLIKSYGPDMVIDYQTENFTQLDEKYDYIFDAVGKSSFGICKQLLKENGVYISSELGPGNENLYLPLFTIFSSKKVIFPFPSNIKKSLSEMLDLIRQNAFKPMIDRIYPLPQIVEAYQYMISQKKIGNVILEIHKE